MPAVSSGDQTTLETFPQGTKLGMAIFQPETIVTALATGSPAVGQQSITLTDKVVDENPVKHFTVYAGSGAGLSDGGKARLKSLSGSTLVVAPNFIDWQTYPYITVKKVIEPWAILPDLENDYEDGDIGYTNENDQYHPLGRIGGLGMVGYTDEAVKFWSDSVAVAPGASLSSYAWVFPSGSPATSTSAGSASSPIEVTWSTATGNTPHYVKYTVTDSNGKTHTRWMPVWIFDDISDSYCDITIDSLNGSFDSGSWRATITALGDADIGQFPEDAMVVVFAQDHYAGHRTEIGGNWQHQENVVFAGWISKDTVFRDKETGSVTFDVLGPIEKMKQLLCWPANLEDKRTPDTWHELKGMNADRATFHIITEHTTMDQICDVVLSGNTKQIKYIDIPEDDPYTQIQDYCLRPIGANLLSDRAGRIYLSKNPNLMPVSDRSGIATIISLDVNSSIRNDPGLTLATEWHEKEVSQVDFVAFGYDGDDPKPYYSLAPGDQYPTGEVRKIDAIRADSQSESNTLSGLYLANENNIWREVKLPVFNWRIFDIAPQEYTELTLAAADTKRGLEWTAQKLICRHVEISYDQTASVLKVTPSFEKDSFGPAGITGDYPDDPPASDGGGVSPTPALPPTMQANPQDLLVGDLYNGAWWLPVGSTAWEARNTGLSPNDVQQLGWDPWWFTEQKKASSNPEEAIIWACEAGGIIFRSLTLGSEWSLKGPSTDPPNTWGDDPAPTLEDLTFIQRSDNIHKNKHHYFIAIWDSDAAGAWRSWLLATQDDGESWVWKAVTSVIMDDDGYIYPSTMKACLGWSGSSPGPNFACTGGQGTAVGEADGEYLTMHYSANSEFTPDADYRINIIFDFGAQLAGIKKFYVRGYKTGTLYDNYSEGLYTTSDANWDAAYSGGDLSGWAPLGDFDIFDPAPGTPAWYRTGGDVPSNKNFRYFALQNVIKTGYWVDGSEWLCDTIRVEGSVSIPAQKGIWLDVDTETGDYLYMVSWTGDDELVLEKINTSTLATVSSISLGACTLAELNGGTYYAAPYTPTFNASRVYVFGRMNAPAGLAGVQHLIQSVDGASTFQSIENGLGASILTNFRAEGVSDGARTFYGIVSDAGAVPKMYRGTEGLAYISDLPLPSGVLINIDAFAIRTDPDTNIATIGVGNPGANAIMVVQSEDDGETWGDATLNLPVDGEITTCVFV